MKADEEVRQLHYTLGWRPKKIIFSELLLELTFWNYKKLKYLDIENVEEKITY